MWVLTYFQGIHFLNKVKLNNLNNKNQHDGASKSKATTGKNTRITNQEHCHTEQ